MATPTNYSACVRIQVLNFSQDKIFVVNAQSAKTAKFFNLENFRLYGMLCLAWAQGYAMSRHIVLTNAAELGHLGKEGSC